MSGLAQAPSAPPGTVPYVFELKASAEVVHALVNPTDLSKRRYFVFIEEPWHRSITRREITKSALSEDPYPDEGATYRNRIKSMWLANGGVKVGEHWVLKSEYALMQRASAMGQVRALETTARSTAVPVKTLATVETVEVGFLKQWGVHGIIGLVVLIAAGLVIRWGFFSEVWLGVDS